MKHLKWLSILLVLVLCLCLAGCGRGKSDPAESPVQQTTDLPEGSDDPETVVQEDEEPLYDENGEEIPPLEVSSELVIELEENQGTGGL